MTRITCEHAVELMQRALGHDVADTPPVLQEHLGECDACADVWATQHAVHALLSAREPAAMPDGFSARLERAIDDLTPWWLRIDWRWWTLRAAAPLAAALLLLVGGAATWTAAAPSTADGSSVTAALVDTSSSVSNDSLLLAVLSGSPDDAVSRYERSAP